MSRIASMSLAAVLGVASIANAQDATTGTASDPSTTSTTTQTTETTATSTEIVDQIRFRGGFSVGGGVALGGVGVMPMGFAQGRFGAQINRMFSVFYAPAGTVGFLLGAASASAIVTSNNAIVANLTLADVFEVGAGPSIDYVVTGSATVGPGGPTAAAIGGVAFGVDTRLAWIPNGAERGENGRRSGFSITLNMHPTFAGGTVVFPILLGLGKDWF